MNCYCLPLSLSGLSVKCHLYFNKHAISFSYYLPRVMGNRKFHVTKAVNFKLMHNTWIRCQPWYFSHTAGNNLEFFVPIDTFVMVPDDCKQVFLSIYYAKLFSFISFN